MTLFEVLVESSLRRTRFIGPAEVVRVLRALLCTVRRCAFHHLRGVHKGLLRCVGRAPDGLRWELGLRPGLSPRFAYRSGDIRA